MGCLDDVDCGGRSKKTHPRYEQFDAEAGHASKLFHTEPAPPAYGARLVTEFIGTFFLVFTLACSVAQNAVLAPLAIGIVLAAMVYMGGHISGANYNPAVSFGLVLRGALASWTMRPAARPSAKFFARGLSSADRSRSAAPAAVCLPTGSHAPKNTQTQHHVPPQHHTPPPRRRRRAPSRLRGGA